MNVPIDGRIEKALKLQAERLGTTMEQLAIEYIEKNLALEKPPRPKDGKTIADLIVEWEEEDAKSPLPKVRTNDSERVSEIFGEMLEEKHRRGQKAC